MNTKKITIIAVIAIVAIMLISMPFFPVSAQAVNEPWPQFHQNALHTGQSASTGPADMVVKWSVTLGGSVVAGAAAAYNNIYVGSCDKNLYCLNAQTGALVWKYTTKWRIRSTPACSNGRVYIGPDDGNVYCLNATTGKSLWNDTLSTLLLAQCASDPFQIRSSPAISGGNLYVGALNGKIYCINAVTGANIWNYTTGNMIVASPAVYNGRVLCGSCDAFFYCLNATNGAKIWSMTPGTGAISGQTQIVGSPTVVQSLNEVVFFANTYSVYYALNINTGAVIWTYYCFKTRPYTWAQTTQCVTWATPAYYAAKNVLFCIDDHFAQELNATNGAALWPLYGAQVPQTPPTYPNSPESASKLPIPDGHAGITGTNPGYTTPYLTTGPNDLGFASVASPGISADGRVYYGTHRQAVLGLNANSTNGQRLSWYETFGWVEASPIVAYGNVYTGDIGWNVYCFTEGTPRALISNDPTHTLPLLSPTTMTGALSASSVSLGSWIYLSGKIGYASGAKVYERGIAFATFNRPDGTTFTANMMAGWDGSYNIPFQPTMAGTWTVIPWWYGDWGYNNGTQGATLSFTVTPSAATFNPAMSQPPSTAIISGVPDFVLYIGATAAVLLISPLAFWRYGKKRQ